jgi:diguanylate cyclase (GGDEF)-like protein
MKERLRTIFHRMIYGPVDRRFYSDNAVLLDRYNFSVLRVVCVCVALVDILYSVFSLFATSRPIVSVTFLCFTGAFVVLWLLVWILVSKKPSLTRLFYYLIYALIYSQTLVLSTVFSPASRMVVVFLVIIMMPVLYVEPPVYSYASLFFTCLIAYMVDVTVKAGNRVLIADDTAAILVCFLVTVPFLTVMREKDLVNISSRKFFQIKAETDGLTGLQNRWSCEMQAREYLSGCENPCALFILDIDCFKKVNDLHGHMAGDRVLAELSKILQAAFRQTDIVGRLGGDEFLVLMKQPGGQEIVLDKAGRIRQEIDACCRAARTVPFTCSIGAAMSDGLPRTFEALYKSADEALYSAKRNGKSSFVLNPA